MTASVQARPGATSISVDKPQGPRRKSRRRLSERWGIVISTTVGIIVLLVAWQLASMYLIKPIWISSPVAVAQRFVLTAQNGTLWNNTVATAEEAFIGLVLGMILGTLAGVLLAEWKPVARFLDPYIIGANSLPRIALAPFFVLWFGIGLFSKVILVISVVFFIALFNAREGMASIDPDLVDVMRSMKASRAARLRHVVLPSLMPWILSAVKIGIGSAIISAVVAEMVGASHGLGWSVTYALQQFDMTGAITSMIVMVVLAMVMYGLISLLERRLFRWRRNSTSSGVAPM